LALLLLFYIVGDGVNGCQFFYLCLTIGFNPAKSRWAAQLFASLDRPRLEKS
jgi:hypothetical protein